MLNLAHCQIACNALVQVDVHPCVNVNDAVQRLQPEPLNQI